jgi:alanine-glyoxylate transaminase / serine-glyoxylate transaminase / serine-pyruvate transaminase
VRKDSEVPKHRRLIPAAIKARKTVNDWIRQSAKFDGVIDFERAVQDPSNPSAMLRAYDHGDHLHPGRSKFRRATGSEVAKLAAIEKMATKFASLNPPHRFLFGPGPTMVHPRVYEALAKPVVGHLDPYFIEVMNDVQQLLKVVYGTTEGTTMAISATGSGGMEAAVSNFVEPGAKFAVFANGYFCDRITEMAKRHGANVVRLEKPWGETFADEEARAFIQKEKPQVVAYVHAETSTGALQKGNAICHAAHEANALVIADCVTSLGGVPIEAEKTGIDIGYSCTQKGLSCPPGLSPMFVSKRAMDWLGTRRTPPVSWYFDLKLIHDYAAVSHRYHHTAPISMFYALREALLVVDEEGAEKRWDRHHRCHEMFVRGIESMGLRMHVAEGRRIWTLNTVVVPPGVDDAKVRKRLMDSEGIEILGGFGPLAGKVFRIGIMGPLATEENVDFLLREFKKALVAEGYRA